VVTAGQRAVVNTVTRRIHLLIWGLGSGHWSILSSVIVRLGSVEGAAGLAGARRAVRLIFAGWVPQDRVSS
jgi:hypothetical protein